MTPTEQGETTGPRPKLAECPFCGSTRLVICGSGPLAAAPFAVSCTTVDCHGAIWALGHHKFDSREEAIAAWNRRHAPQPPKVTEGELLAEAERVLEPFAEEARQIAENNPGWDHDDFQFRIGARPSTLGPYRAARVLLTRIKEHNNG